MKARRRAPKLPVVTFGGRTPTQRAIQQAQAWQRAHARVNTPTPSETYLVIRDLLLVVLQDHAGKCRGVEGR